MALKQRNTTRWTAWVGTWIAVVISFVLDVLQSFLNFKREDGLLTKGKKTANVVIRRTAYFIADYYLVALSAGVVATMKYFGFTFLWMFIALWIFDIIVAIIFFAIYEKTGEDLSLGVDYRRAVDTIRRKSPWIGIGATLVFVVQAIFWTGPEKVVTFFRKEIGTIPRVLFVLLILTAIQSLIWVPIYGFGYDLLVSSKVIRG